ncbi:MAG: hypothetical protein ACLQLG_11480 [Thermoguttaceae bacterium]
MAFWRWVAYTGAVVGPMLCVGAGCSGKLPPPPPEVANQVEELGPPTVELGQPVNLDAGPVAKVAAKT